MRVVLLGALALAIGCGSQVVVRDDGAASGEGGGGGASPDYECVLGGCGDSCVKCVDDECFNGQCTEEGRCIDSLLAVDCAE
jgi:hypothetical protein